MRITCRTLRRAGSALAAALVLGAAPGAHAEPQIAEMSAMGTTVWWTPVTKVPYTALDLAVSSPAGAVTQESFRAGVDPSYDAAADGTYRWELRVSLAPASGAPADFTTDGAAKPGEPTGHDFNGRPVYGYQKAPTVDSTSSERSPQHFTQSGAFSVINGAIVDGSQEEN